MLLAVEGGGFFTSSATGYSKGLSLLFLGQRHEERPMRVSPWNQYRLVDREVEPDLQLASRKKQASHGCASFICFGRASSETDAQSPSETAGSVQQSEALTDSSSASDKGEIHINDVVDEDQRKVCRKSSLKKTSADCSVKIGGVIDDAHDSLEEEVTSVEAFCAERRKVHWTDACGRELAQIREFEVSDEIASDDEFEDEGDRKCQCVIQ
ncbi:hypothetical protein J5N97_019257 [Dioscorea zingiberensis]|uniref:Uncharacterized protein n=1 Tax=Dioscorea zingiberensis TaxID=325984 RepID=A0A9D5HCP5_9LILI|nr:hypothetical protein J5N97_019257 [Dioscorea zingiberensis]